MSIVIANVAMYVIKSHVYVANQYATQLAPLTICPPIQTHETDNEAYMIKKKNIKKHHILETTKKEKPL